MATTVLTTIKIRGDTSAAWTAANPVLAARELAIETNTGRLKIGDGVTAWATLPYLTGTAAVRNIGTSGANVPLLNTANSWSAMQTFSMGAAGTPNVAYYMMQPTDYGPGKPRLFIDQIAANNWRLSMFDTTGQGGIFTVRCTSFVFQDAGGVARFTADNTGVNIPTGNTYKVNNIPVVGARVTGWGAMTGTATRSAFDTATVTLPQLAERVKALIDDLRTHGLIGN